MESVTMASSQPGKGLSGLAPSYPDRVSVSPVYLGVILLVFSRATKKVKVLLPVVILLTIYMMDSLFWCKVSADHFFHNQPMFVNVTVFVSIWMFWRIYLNVAKRMPAFPALPIPMLIPGFVSNEALVPGRLSLFGTIPCIRSNAKMLAITPLGTKLLLSGQQFIAANRTSSHDCYYTQKVTR